MSLLSEAPASRMDGDRIASGAAKSAPPPGVRSSRRDLRDLSLAEYWGDRFRKATGDLAKLEFFLYLAEQDLRRARTRHEPVDPHERPAVRSARVISQYEGLSSLEAAVAEDCSDLWIRVTRLEAGRAPEDGW